MSDDLLITPGSRKLEIKDNSGNVDAKIETDASGNLLITNAGGDISIGDTSSDVFIGDGTNNVDIVFEQDGEIRGTSGVTLTLGASGSSVVMATDLSLGGNDLTNVGDLTVTGNLTITGDINSYNVTDLDVTDKTITLGVGQTEANSGNSGIIIDGSSASILWGESSDRWIFNKGISTSGPISSSASSGSSFYAASFTRSSSGLVTPDIWGSSSTLVLGTSSTDERLALSTSGALIYGRALVRQASSDQNTNQDSASIPDTTGAEIMRFEGNYTDGKYTTEFAKVDRSGNLPLYVRQSKGAANSFSNIARFGDHGQTNGSDVFAVFGGARVGGRVTADNLTLNSISTQSSETTVLTINTSNIVGKRDLGSNAFNSTTIPTNNNQLTNGAGYITASNTAITNKLPLAGGTMTGNINMGGNTITGSNYNISGVNALTINDPGEGIIFTGTNNVVLYAIDDAADNIMKFDGAAKLLIGNNTALMRAEASVATNSTATSSTDFVTVFNVNGSNLGSCVVVTGHGTTGNVVVNFKAEILVNHSQDIFVSSISGNYTQMDIKVTSNNNEDFAIEFKRTDTQTSQAGIKYTCTPLDRESIVTAVSSHSYTGTTLTHRTKPGSFQSATDGADHAYFNNMRVGGYIYHDGDTDTSIKFDTNRVRIFDGGGTYLDTNNGSAVLHTSTTFGGDVSGTYNAIVVADDSHNHVISNVDGLQAALDGKTPLDHLRSLGTTAFTAGGGSNSTATTAQYISEMEGDGAFDSYTSAFKTSWSYASNDNLSDAGSFGPTETAGMAHLTWTDNSNDSTRGNITVLAIAPNTGGSAGGVYVYNDQGSTYSPGWREIWTSSTDGSGSGLDADKLDAQEGSYYLNYNNFTNTPTIPTNSNYVTVGSRYTGDASNLLAASKASIRLWDVSTGSDDPSGASDGIILTAGWDSTSWGIQQYHDFHSNDLYLRSKQNGTWMSTWDRVFHDTYHPNADKWTTSRTLSLTGDVSGSTSWDGSGNASISVAVSNDSHTHAFNNLTAKTSGTGTYSTSGYFQAGRGSGGVALTHNDGYGNANVTFNHVNGIPEQGNNCGRIVVNTDSTTNATMTFELLSNTGTTAVNTPSAMELTETGAYFPQYLYHLADTDTYIRFTDNRVRIVAAGTTKFDSNNTYLTGNQTITLTGDASGSGTTSIAVTVADDSHNHVISNVDGLQTALDGKLPLTGGTMTGELQLNARLDVGDGSGGETEIRVYKADNNVSDHIQFYNGTTRVGEIGCEDTTWLRINQETAKNIYTPRYIRADGGLFVDSTNYGIDGSGKLKAASIPDDSRVTTANSTTMHQVGLNAVTNTGSSYMEFRKQTNTGEPGNIYFYTSAAATTSRVINFRMNHKDFHADGDITAYSTQTGSDIRLKKNIRDLDSCLDKTLSLRGVKFDWKDEHKGNDQLGFIAQEVEEVLPEVVNDIDSLGDRHGETHKVVNYQAVVPVLVEAIKELKQEIDDLKDQLKNKEL
jgi:hypothetical protein